MKVAIVGFSETTRMRAPYDDASWEIWTVNDAWTWIPRADRWFEPHARWIYEWFPRRPQGHVARLAMFGGPIYMTDPDERIPNSRRYPIEAVVADIGRPYLTSSIAYALALAIHEGADEIGVWGVDMAGGTEYAAQRPCCEWLLGLAAGRGIRLTIPECPLLSGDLYGRGALNPGGERITPAQLMERMALLEQARNDAANEAQLAQGAVDGIQGQITELRFWLTNAPPGVHPPTLNSRLTLLEQERAKAQKRGAKARSQFDQMEGMLHETQFWIGQTPQGQAQELFGAGGEPAGDGLGLVELARDGRLLPAVPRR